MFNHNLVKDDLLGRLRLPLTGAGKVGMALGKRATYDLLPQGAVDLTITHLDEATAAAAASAANA